MNATFFQWGSTTILMLAEFAASNGLTESPPFYREEPYLSKLISSVETNGKSPFRISMSKHKLSFSEGIFLQATLSSALQYRLPEIAIVGRSNVGKSSLINHLLRNKQLAKVSSRPGKTQSINFYEIDRKLLLVDLPGYGYAQADKKSQRNWSAAIDNYLESKRDLKAILHLIDSRRSLTEDDIAFLKWATAKELPLLFLFTKIDVLSPHEIESRREAIASEIQSIIGEKPIKNLTYSVKNSSFRLYLIKAINELINS
jgi:GTP-binding protein